MFIIWLLAPSLIESRLKLRVWPYLSLTRRRRKSRARNSVTELAGPDKENTASDATAVWLRHKEAVNPKRYAGILYESGTLEKESLFIHIHRRGARSTLCVIWTSSSLRALIHKGIKNCVDRIPDTYVIWRKKVSIWIILIFKNAQG